MELFWFVFIRICWVLGTILSLREIASSDHIKKQIQESNLGDAPGLLVLLFLLLSMVCALWPIWTSAEIFIKIGRRIKKE